MGPERELGNLVFEGSKLINIWPFAACVKDDVMNMVAPRMAHEITRWPFYSFLSGAMRSHALLAPPQYLPSPFLPLTAPFAQNAQTCATLSSVAFVWVSLQCSVWPPLLSLSVFQRPSFRAFVLPSSSTWAFQWLLATILHKLILFQGQAEALQTSGYEFRYQLNHSMGLGPWFIRQWLQRDGSPANLPSVDSGHSR